jgi:hypothetical protein
MAIVLLGDCYAQWEKFDWVLFHPVASIEWAFKWSVANGIPLSVLLALFAWTV